MTIVTTTVTVDYRYLMRRTKDRLVSLYEQLTGERLTIDQYREMKALPKHTLADRVWKVWSSLPE